MAVGRSDIMHNRYRHTFRVWMAIGDLIAGLILCVTIIGIPFGLQFFKLAKLSLMPFGARIV